MSTSFDRQLAGLRRLRAWLPQGRVLPQEVWERRHRSIIVLLWLHVAGLFVFGLVQGEGVIHTALEMTPIAAAALAATPSWMPRSWRAGSATFGLFISSAVLVHLSGGSIEAHFHFFVLIGVITLYQDWFPFLLAIAFVAFHHGVMGTLDPASVYNHPAAQRTPWSWAAIHAAFVLAASGAHIASWRLNERTALRDSLTGLANRTLLADRLDHAVLRRERTGHDLAVLVVDLDRFKEVNDTLGHASGDEILVEAASRLLRCIRLTDTAGRLGGDEFAVVLEGSGELGAVQVAERFLASLAEPIRVGGREVVVSASVGIAVAGGDSTTAGELLRNADLSMYLAKARGRSCFVLFHDSMHVEAVTQKELEDDLRAAVGKGELVLHYQPTVVLETGEVAGVEALVRWQHPERGLLGPDQFIPVAEQTGVIHDLGRWVLHEACRQGRLWHDTRADRPPLTVAVNVSAKEIQEGDFVGDVERALASTGFDPGHLVLEITESLLVANVQSTVSQLEALRAKGIRVAVDDFGTGYSSLSYLRHFPIDILKIDRSFIAGIGAHGQEWSLARAIVDIGHTLQLEVVAEGIEELGQASELAAINCELGQGFLFCRPMPAAELERSLDGASSGADVPGRPRLRA